MALTLVLLIVVYLDRRNPMMGFLVGGPFMVLSYVCCICSAATGVVLYALWRKKKSKKKHTEQSIQK
jgi:hypothetical protein